MTALKLTFAAAAFTVGLAASASAMPVPKLGVIDVGVQADQVRTVCNQWGRCWWVPGSRHYNGGGYGYRHRGYRGGYRRW